jgi:hypothetical protein
VIKEMIRVAKNAGKIGFPTWPPKLAIGSIFKVNPKHLQKISSNNNPSGSTPSPILWGVPEITKDKRQF